MYQFIKNLLAAGILFISLITSVALSYAITPANVTPKPSKVLKIQLNIKQNNINFNLNHTLKLLTPKVGQ